MKPLITAGEERGEKRGKAKAEAEAEARFDAWKQSQREKGVLFAEHDEEQETRPE